MTSGVMCQNPHIVRMSNAEIAEAIVTAHDLYYKTAPVGDDRRGPILDHYKALLKEQERRAISRERL